MDRVSFPKLFDNDDDDFAEDDGIDGSGNSDCYFLSTYYMHNFLSEINFLSQVT